VPVAFTMDLSNQNVAIPVLGMAIEPLDGGAAPTMDTRVGAAPLSDNGVTRIRIGSAIIAHAGAYRMSADGDVSASPNPQLRMFHVAGVFAAHGNYRLDAIGIRYEMRWRLACVSFSPARLVGRMVRPSGTAVFEEHVWAGRSCLVGCEPVFVVGRPCDLSGCAVSAYP
jgi:hypothetical protein